MRSPISLIVPILSFLSFAVTAHLHSNSSHPARNQISARQFRYPRAVVDICADINQSLIPEVIGSVDLGSLLNDFDTCLCLSALPLVSDLEDEILTSLVDLLGGAEVESLVQQNGIQCTDDFVKNGPACSCPNSVRNGNRRSSPNTYGSALPRTPKMKRTVIPSRGLDLGGLLSGLLGSGLDITSLVNNVIKSLGISVPISGGYQSTSLEADLSVCIGAGLSGTQSLLNTITDIVNSLLSSLLGTTVKCNINSTCSAPIDSLTISIALRVGGLSDLSLGSTLDKLLGAVAELLNGLLGGVKIETTCSVDGPTNSTTPTLSSSTHSLPSPSTSVGVPDPSVSPSSPAGIDLSGLLDGTSDQLLGQIEGILAGLGLSSYSIETGANLAVGVSIGLSDTLSSVDGLVADVLVIVNNTLASLLGFVVQLDPSSTSPPISQGESIVVDIDLGAIIDGILSDKDGLLEDVSLAVSEVLASLLNTQVTTTTDGGPSCGCGGPKMASAKR